MERMVRTSSLRSPSRQPFLAFRWLGAKIPLWSTGTGRRHVEGLDEKGDTRLSYRLSPIGAEVLRAEAMRLERLVGLARQSEVL
ncbi:MAG: hypothetical protein V3T83_03170 [Acidobacteriota bacterium]